MKLDKILKKLDKATIEEMDAMDEPKIKNLIAVSEESIARATRERDGNDKYRSAKLAVKDLSEGLKDVKKRQNAKIQYALRCLRALNGEDVGSEE